MNTTVWQEPWPEDVLARFLTQGGAVVDLHRQEWKVYHYATQFTPAEMVEKRGFNWRCLGCDAIGGGDLHSWDGRGYEEREPRESRQAANEHATECRALPRPGGAR